MFSRKTTLLKHNTKQTIKKKANKTRKLKKKKKSCAESYNLIDGSLKERKKEKKTTLRDTILIRKYLKLWYKVFFLFKNMLK